MTFNNVPTELITELCKTLDRIEDAIRADERAKIRGKVEKAFPARPVAKPKPETLYPMTDMHGHPLQEIASQPKTYDPAAAFDYAGQGLNETHRRLIARLSEGTFYAVPTLAGHLNIKKESVYHYLSGIKKAGYEMEIRSTGNRKGGYVNIYRLAKTG